MVIKIVLLLDKQYPSYNDIADCIHTFFFLATPHRGFNLASTLSSCLKLGFGHGSKHYLNSLKIDSEAIQAINDHFRFHQGVQLYSFFETVPTSLGLIVEKSSAILGLPGEQISHLDGNHSQVCKLETPSDRNYCRLRDAFASAIKYIEETQTLSGVHLHQDKMDRLSLYLGLKQRPEIDFANAIDHLAEGSCTWLTNKPSFHQWLDDFDDSSRFFSERRTCVWQVDNGRPRHHIH